MFKNSALRWDIILKYAISVFFILILSGCSEGKLRSYKNQITNKISEYRLDTASSSTVNTADALEIYVSPSGSDSGNGSIENPFRTIEKAQREIREMKSRNSFSGPVIVYLREGTYELSEPLQFTLEDSGDTNKPITYQAYHNEEVTVSGGKTLSLTWEKINNGIYKSSVSSIKPFSTLIVNGKKAIRARTPNAPEYFYVNLDESKKLDPDTTKFNDESSNLEKESFIFREHDIRSDWQNIQDAEVVSFQAWQSSRQKIKSVNEEKNLVTLQGKTQRPYTYWISGRYYIENILEGLDQEGEWYLDKEEQTLYYKPFAGENIHTSTFLAPQIEGTLLSVDGKPHSFSPQNGFTISFFLKTDSKEPNTAIVSNTYQTTGFRIGLSEGKLSYQIGGVGAKGNVFSRRNTCSQKEINDNLWHQATVTFDLKKGTIGCYVDTDASLATQSFVGNFDIQKFNTITPEIGNGPCAKRGAIDGRHCEPYTGELDEFRFYHAPLPPSEIFKLHTGNPPTSGLITYFDFENTVRDTSPRTQNYRLYGEEKYGTGVQGSSLILDGKTNIALPPQFVENIHIQGIQFLHSDWNIDSAGYAGSQAGTGIPIHPAVVFNYCSGCSFSNNEIAFVGGHAIGVKHSNNTNITKNHIHDIGSGGIYIGSERNNLDEVSNHINITDNKIYNLSYSFHDAAAIWVERNNFINISHNEIFDVDNIGITVGWLWAPSESTAHDNTISYNEVYRIKKILNDGGAIYTLGYQPGTSIHHNIVHDVVFTPHHLYYTHIRGLYLDQGSKDILVENNLVYRTGDTPMNLHIAFENTIQNNIFIDGGFMGIRDHFERKDERQETLAHGNKVLHNLIYFGNKNKILSEESTGTSINSTLIQEPGFMIRATRSPKNLPQKTSIEESDNNLFYASEQPPLFSGENPISYAEWQDYGFDAHSIVGKGQIFIDYENDNFTLNMKNPSLQQFISQGFEPIDFTGVGPRIECFIGETCTE